ncbi:hypothetical protein [Phyllobacterium sp. CL33Tsu]|uniref:hypothetical protein n=1 Tax=Phyllobacterium sp. CL33Tsu TaxID=1798191 RepID=UPI001113772C|nr:hypothetical protein [Phyllobacterium sp. CL33Tsu]
MATARPATTVDHADAAAPQSSSVDNQNALADAIGRNIHYRGYPRAFVVKYNTAMVMSCKKAQKTCGLARLGRIW